MSEKEAKPLVPLVITFLIAFVWLLFILLYALFWSTDFTWFQNIVITIVSLLMAGLVIGLTWVVWGMTSGEPSAKTSASVEEFVKVAETTEVPAGSMRKFVVGGEEILIANVEGKYYALGGKCTHRGGDLSKGVLSGNVVKCPRHGARFDVTSGGVVGGPAKKSEPTFEVRVEGKNILVRKG